MFEYSQIQALRQMVGADEMQHDIVQNYNKGSELNPGDIGEGKKTELAKPNTKVQAKVGKKYEKKQPQVVITQNKATTKSSKSNKNAIWTQDQINDLPVSKGDSRKTPQFQTMYRQKVGAEDVFLGLSQIDQTSVHCQEMKYVIHLPGCSLKQISLDINETAMVIQTKEFYLHEHFQYKTIPGQSKAKFISDKGILELILIVTRDFV